MNNENGFCVSVSHSEIADGGSCDTGMNDDRFSPRKPRDAERNKPENDPTGGELAGQAVDRPAKPPRIEVIADNIPLVLRELPGWLVWNWVWSQGKKKYDKPPLQTNGNYAKTNDQDTWCSFEEAMAAVLGGHFDGVGFVLRKECGIVGIDLDDCRDPSTGRICEPAASIIRELESYGEVSPSGKGVKLFMYGNIPLYAKKVNHAAGIEVYDEGRYLTVTGQHLDDTPKEINSRQTTTGVVAS